MESIIRAEDKTKARKRQPPRWPKRVRRKTLTYVSNTIPDEGANAVTEGIEIISENLGNPATRVHEAT